MTKLSGLEGQVESRKATFRFSSEPGVEFQCTKDRRDPKPCASPVRWRGLAPGHHHLTVTAKNSAGYTGAARWHIRVLEPRGEDAAVHGLSVSDLRASTDPYASRRITFRGGLRNYRSNEIGPERYPMFLRLDDERRSSLPLGSVRIRGVRGGHAAPFVTNAQLPRRAEPGRHEVVLCQPAAADSHKCGYVIGSTELWLQRPARLVAEPPEISFPSLGAGDSELGITYIRNRGQLMPGLTEVTITGPNADEFRFYPTARCDQVEGGAWCWAEVLFAPSTPGDKQATLVLDPQLGKKLKVGLTGTATE